MATGILLTQGKPFGVFFSAHASGALTPGVEQEILTFIVPVNKIRWLGSLILACRAETSWRCTADGSVIASGRTGPAKPTDTFPFFPLRPINATVEIKVFVLARAGTPITDFEAHVQATDTIAP